MVSETGAAWNELFADLTARGPSQGLATTPACFYTHPGYSVLIPGRGINTEEG